MYVKLLFSSRFKSVQNKCILYSLSNVSAGFEIQPEETPYDKEVKSLYNAMKKHQKSNSKLLESTKQINCGINFLFFSVLEISNDDDDDDHDDDDHDDDNNNNNNNNNSSF